MNPFWKELLRVLTGVVIVALILYELFYTSNDRLSLFLLLVLLWMVGVQLVANTTRMLYNFGFWFFCWH